MRIVGVRTCGSASRSLAVEELRDVEMLLCRKEFVELALRLCGGPVRTNQLFFWVST